MTASPEIEVVVKPGMPRAPPALPLLLPLMKPPVSKPQVAPTMEHSPIQNPQNPYEWIKSQVGTEPKAWKTGW